MIRTKHLATRLIILAKLIASRIAIVFPLLPALILLAESSSQAQTAILAGTAKIDITDHAAGPVNDPLYAKVLVLQSGSTQCVLVSLDAVAVGEIGHIKNDYLPTVRLRCENELDIPASQIVINASHCHGVVCADVADRTVEAIRLAKNRLQAVRVGHAIGHEDRIMENRRLRMKDGREIDVRHAYSLPPDDQVAGVGPIDPKIAAVRFDRLDGSPLAVLYQFACHPIQGVANGGNTADIIGFASEVLEESLGNDCLAIFFQGCGGDINPRWYKDVDHPRDARWHGQTLGMSTLQTVRKIETAEHQPIALISSQLELPRADLAPHIAALEAERERLLNGLQGTSLNLKTYLPLVLKHQLDPQFPAYSSHAYLSESQRGVEELRRMDSENKRNLQAYTANIHTMEALTRLQTNLALLKQHQLENTTALKRGIDTQLCAIRIGDFRLLTFPGELTVPVGLHIQSIMKQRNPNSPMVFISGYTNGYIYYCPTPEQLKNIGGAQEDSDCILDPTWFDRFEPRAIEMLESLGK